MLGGRTVIERVYRNVENEVDDIVVATDDVRIAQAVEAFGGNVVMTRTDHRSGTDRCFEAYVKTMADETASADTVVINIQGDEPFIHPQQIAAIRQCFADPTTDIATLVKPFTPADGFAALQNPNTPKVVVNGRDEAMYFSRSVIPYLRGVEAGDEWLSKHTYYKHIGLYAYRAKVLAEITQLPPSALELAESLEQLRWLQNGYRIKVGYTDIETIGIDTPADLQRAEAFLAASC